jgi:hypothetical protein
MCDPLAPLSTVPDGARIPIETLDRLDLDHFTTPIARALHRRHDGIVRKSRLQVAESQRQRRDAAALDLDRERVLIGIDRGHRQVVAHKERLVGRVKCARQQRQRWLGVERLGGSNLEEGGAGGVGAIRILSQNGTR